MQIPEIIADLQRAGLTQTEIASRAGLAQSTVSQLLTGERGKRPSVQTAGALLALWNEVYGPAAAPQHAAGQAKRGQAMG